MDSMSLLYGSESGIIENPTNVVERSGDPSANANAARFNSFLSQLSNYLDAANISSLSFGLTMRTSVVTLVELATWIIGWSTLAVELPMLILASYALARLVKSDNVAPIYVINLLITDLIQLSVRPVLLPSVNKASSIFLAVNVASSLSKSSPSMIFHLALSAGNGFMVCIALERYLLVAHPLWYKCRRSIRHSLMASVLTWAFAGSTLFLQSKLARSALVFHDLPRGSDRCFNFFTERCGDFCPFQLLFLLYPLPLLLLFLIGTYCGLRGSMSVTFQEKRSILGVLLLVLVNYTALFLPSVMMLLIKYIDYRTIRGGGQPWHNHILLGVLDAVALALLYVSPLLDSVLYVFLRRNATDTLQAFPCLPKLLARWRSGGASSKTK